MDPANPHGTVAQAAMESVLAFVCQYHSKLQIRLSPTWRIQPVRHTPGKAQHPMVQWSWSLAEAATGHASE